MRINRRGIDLCPSCQNGSQIEDVAKDAGYIRRLRGCKNCGATWSTAEIGLADLRRMLKMKKKVSELLK
jgi:transcriptional regulator NrdR family protein